ncbi:collagenase [Streptomyces sp. KR80]|uniref:collagenase n=1 Tax=Streptomyces sp. KR80 TaxID=3457426 RepID=UPI003FCF1346
MCRGLRRPLLTVAIAVTLCAAAQTRYAAPLSPAPAAPHRAVLAHRAVPAQNPHDEVDRLAEAPRRVTHSASGPGGLSNGRVPGPQTPEPSVEGSPPQATINGTAVPCNLDSVTGLPPDQFVAFLADPEVTADDCLRDILWKWDQRLVPIMSKEHVQAVSRRIAELAADHDGKNGTHLLEMFTYLHAVAYQDFSHDEIDISDPTTLKSMRQAVDAFGAAARTFDATRANGETLREALNAASTSGLRQYQLPLIKRVLATMDASHPDTNKDASWGGAALGALSVNYLGVYPGNEDTAFRDAVAADASYRAAFKAFADYTHLKDTDNAWVVRDALGEYGRFGQIDAVKSEIVDALGELLETTVRNFGDGSPPWGKVVTWLIEFDACKPYKVCKEDIERRIFPHTYTYDKGGIKVRTALKRATVDQLYYASKQVKAQFHRVLGTDKPLAGDTNTTLHTVLYASRADYEVYQPMLTGLSTDNGGIYIEKGATFYTYQRRVPEDSTLTLEELFRHEYTHYLNGRWAVPGLFGEGPWYEGDRTTAMDEGTAEFFDGGTRDDGIKVRKSLVQGIINDTQGGGPRMTVDQLLHATYDGDGFRFYNYAGTFFEFLWTERPSLIREMYGHLRADDPADFDAWRSRLSQDAGLQRAYNAFLDEQIAHVDDLFVPDTKYTPIDQLKDSSADEVRSSFASTTGLTPDCTSPGASERPRFICTGKITAKLTSPDNADVVFKDMSEAVDGSILDRAEEGDNNLADMNCSFGKVEISSDGRTGTADYSCEGPLRG